MLWARLKFEEKRIDNTDLPNNKHVSFSSIHYEHSFMNNVGTSINSLGEEECARLSFWVSR